jgi:DNA polymerase III alpha subunit
MMEEDDKGVALIYRLPESAAVYRDFYNKDTDSSFQFNTSLIKGYIKGFNPTKREHLNVLTALCRPGALDAPIKMNAVVVVEYDDGTIEYHPKEEYEQWQKELKNQK